MCSTHFNVPSPPQDKTCDRPSKREHSPETGLRRTKPKPEPEPDPWPEDDTGWGEEDYITQLGHRWHKPWSAPFNLEMCQYLFRHLQKTRARAAVSGGV